MKSRIASCATLAFALSISCAFADEIKPIEGPKIVTKDTIIAYKIIGNGVMPDGRECIVGTTKDCTAKGTVIAGKIIGNGLKPDGETVANAK